MREIIRRLDEIEREVHHRFVSSSTGEDLLSTGFHVGLPELLTRKMNAAQGAYSLSYVLRGEGEFRDDKGKRFTFAPGSVVQRYPNRRYSIHRFESFEHLEFFMIPPQSLYASFLETGIAQSEPSVFKVGLDAVFLKRLLSYVHDFKTYTRNETRHLLLDTIPLILEFYRRERLMQRSQAEDDLIERASYLLGDELDQSLNLESIAESLGLSYESFRKKFRKAKNTSPAQFRTQKRLECAMSLLIEDAIPIKQIAYELGYANPSSFTKRFQTATGQSPATFRDAHRKRMERNL